MSNKVSKLAQTTNEATPGDVVDTLGCPRYVVGGHFRTDGAHHEEIHVHCHNKSMVDLKLRPGALTRRTRLVLARAVV